MNQNTLILPAVRAWDRRQEQIRKEEAVTAKDISPGDLA